jgi:hypothetical protein
MRKIMDSYQPAIARMQQIASAYTPDDLANFVEFFSRPTPHEIRPMNRRFAESLRWFIAVGFTSLGDFPTMVDIPDCHWKRVIKRFEAGRNHARYRPSYCRR